MIRVLAAIFAVAFQCASAFAQNYPSRPITMIVPFAAGGPADTLARFLAEPMRHSLNRPVIIESRISYMAAASPLFLLLVMVVLSV